MNPVRSFVRFPAKEKALFFEAVFFLFFAKIVVLLFPFRRSVKLLKRQEETKEENPDILTLIRIRKAIRRANRLAFWKNICLVKSMAARLMLQRRHIPSVMYLGLQFKNNKELVAHAWLVANDIQITPKGNTNYKEIFSV